MRKIVLLLSLASIVIVLASFNTSVDTKEEQFSTDEEPLPDTSFARSAVQYQSFCGGCHGEKMNAFVDRAWKHGKSREDLYKAIKTGYPNEGMPAFDSAFNDQDIYQLADYIITGIKNVDRYSSSDKPVSNIFKTKTMTIRLDTIVKGLFSPWGMVFLPGSEMLVSDRNGKIYHVKKDRSTTLVEGGPEVVNEGQGGLMDVALDPAFTTNHQVYFSYSKRDPEKKDFATTAIMKAVFSSGKLSEQKDIFVASPYTPTHHHFGSRMQFGRDGYLYFSVGERGNEKENPQEIMHNDLGKIHRITTDGTAPADNPFVQVAGASATIYSFGHRNPQGLTMHPLTGKIWETEHGPRGGDEINIIRPGKNYGWPVITYGINYNGKPMAPDTKTAKPGMEQPLYQWTPSIAPGGIQFVTGKKYKGWDGNLLTSAMRFQYLNRSVIKNDKVVEEEILFKNIGRVRNIRLAPDGFLYMAVEFPGVIYKLVPVK